MRQEKNWLAKPLAACLLAMLCCFLWGSAIPLVKIGFQELGLSSGAVASEMVFAGVRFAIAGCLILLLAARKARRFVLPGRRCLARAAEISCFQTVGQYFFYYIGLSRTSGVRGAVIIGTNVFAVLLLSCLVFRIEKLTFRKLMGCILGFAGIVLMNLGQGGFSGTFRLSGEGFLLLSTLVYAVSPILMKRYGAQEDVMQLSGWQFLIGGVVLAVGGLLAGGTMGTLTPVTLALLLYLSLVSAVAYTLWSVLLQYHPVSRIAVYGFMNPVFGVLLSACFLGEVREAFSLQNLLALFLVCAGIYWVNKSAPLQ